MADTIKTIKPTGGDYPSLAAWEAGQQKSIASGDREIAECYAMVDYTTTSFAIDGWTVPAGAEIIVRAATGEGHTGKLGTGYIFIYDNVYGAFSINEDNVTLDRMQGYAVRTATAGNIIFIAGQPGSLNAVVKNCLISSWMDPGGYAVLSQAGGTPNTQNTKFINTIAIQMNPAVSNTALRTLRANRAYNCFGINYGTGPGYLSANDINTGAIKNVYAYSAGGADVAQGYAGSLPSIATCMRSDSTPSWTGWTNNIAFDNTNFKEVEGITDSFTGADNDPLDSAKWETVDGTACKITSNKAVPVDGYAYTYLRLKGTFDEAHFAQVVGGQITGDASSSSYLAVRMQSNGDCYMISVADTATTIYKIISGTQTYLGDFLHASTGMVTNTLGTMRVEVFGQRVFVWANDVYLGTYLADGTLTGGSPGVVFDKSNTTPTADDFVGGNFPDYSLPAGSALIGAGTDLSADADYPFSTDILGATRSGTWDVGPFAWVSGARPFFVTVFKAAPSQMNAGVGFAGAALKRASKTFSGVLSWVGSLLGEGPGGGTEYTQGLTAALSFVGNTTKASTRAAGGALSFVGNTAKQLPRSLAGALGFTVGATSEPIVTLLTNGFDAGNANNDQNTASISVNAGDTIIVDIAINGYSGGNLLPDSVSGAGLTFDLVGSTSDYNNWSRQSRYRAQATGSGSGAVTISLPAGQAWDLLQWAVVKVTGLAQGGNGASAFVQTVIGETASNGSVYDLTLSAFADANNICLVQFVGSRWSSSRTSTANFGDSATELWDESPDGGSLFYEWFSGAWKAGLTTPDVTWQDTTTEGRSGIASELAVAASVAGGLVKRTGKTLSGVASFAGAMSRAMSKVLASVLSWAGNLATQLAGGPQNFDHIMTATLSFVGASQKRTSRAITAVLSFSGATRKRVARSLSGGLSWVGALASIKAVNKLLTATLSFTGSISRRPRKALNSVISFSGSIARRTRKTVTATLSWFGNFVSQKIGGPQNFTQSLSGALSFTGPTSKRVAKRVTSILSFTGNVTKRLSRTVTGALSFVGSISYLKAFNKALTATLTFAGLHRRRANKAAVSVVTFVGAQTKRTTHRFSSGLTFVGNTVKRSYRNLIATITFAGSVLRARLKVLAITATLTFTGASRNRANKSLTAAITFVTTMHRYIRTAANSTLEFYGVTTRFIVKVSMNAVVGFTSLMTAFVGYVTLSTERAYRILAQNRYYVIMANGRIRIVTAEDRDQIIASQDRYREVAAEDRDHIIKNQDR